MGNRNSSVQPAGPPPLLSAAVMGDFVKFQEAWNDRADGGAALEVKDRQNNNVLHALFSCRGRADAKCIEILDFIHRQSSSSSTDESVLEDAYKVRNDLGCTPLWILIAYGNVDLLKHVQTKFVTPNKDEEGNNDEEKKKKLFMEMVLVPNHQGDTPLLATCSQGNKDMVRYLKEEIMSSEQQQFTTALSESNKKGTTPLQIIVGNSHTELLQYLLSSKSAEGKQQPLLSKDLLLQKNTAGLSLFHICSERNSTEILSCLLSYYIDDSSDDDNDDNNKTKKKQQEAIASLFDIKDKNGATGLHVAAFCGNLETVKLWIDTTKKAFTDDNDNDNDNTTTGMKEVVNLLDKMDNEARTPYWLAMVQGHENVGKLLAEVDDGIDTKHPNMVKEIEQAKKQREERASARQQQMNMRPGAVDGSTLLGRR